MPKDIKQYDILISCPGDIKDELDMITHVIEEFNALYTDVLGISLRTKHWKKNSYPESGGRPQELLNKQIVDLCDAAIAIFWTRFGSSTDKYDSGTEEEIEEMIAAGKQVFVYFSETPKKPADIDQDQYKKVQEFKERYRENSLDCVYESLDEFEKLLFAHLSSFYLSKKAVEQVKKNTKSELVIKAIVDGNLSDIIKPVRFGNELNNLIDERKEDAKGLFKKILKYKINFHQTPADVDTLYRRVGLAIFKPVEIQSDQQQLIKYCAKQLDISLPDNFFALGDLGTNLLDIPMPGCGSNITGSDDEINKYNDINDLYSKLRDLLAWMGIDKKLNDLLCVKLAIANQGNDYDEDIEIFLTVKKDVLLPHYKLPNINNVLKDFSDYTTLCDIFNIPASQYYKSYDQTIQEAAPISYTPQRVPLWDSYSDSEDEYYDTLGDVFECNYFEDGDDIIIKIDVDYLKHNTAAAFPTPIFVTTEDVAISYRITSKRNKEEIHGELGCGEKAFAE